MHRRRIGHGVCLLRLRMHRFELLDPIRRRVAGGMPYAGASVFSAFGLGYRYSMWLTKPPTRLFWRRAGARGEKVASISKSLAKGLFQGRSDGDS